MKTFFKTVIVPFVLMAPWMVGMISVFSKNGVMANFVRHYSSIYYPVIILSVPFLFLAYDFYSKAPFKIKLLLAPIMMGGYALASAVIAIIAVWGILPFLK